MTRYALYFTPSAASPWWEAGCQWLGYDPLQQRALTPPAIPGVPPQVQSKLTSDARRYGFHATFKAPFRLGCGFTEAQLAKMAQAFCKLQQSIVLDRVEVRPLGGFLALRPAASQENINALAMRCLSYFDLLRAAPTEAELGKRRRGALTLRQEVLLDRWGYPYVEEEFRFHMTLTHSLRDIDADISYALRRAAEAHFAELAQTPLVVDALTIFKEEAPGQPFSVWRRFAFEGVQSESRLPSSGRIFYCVGPSGAGKDSLLRWVQEHLPSDAEVVFARRAVTRAPHDSEDFDAIDEATFWKQAAEGCFAMIWQANELCYGIPRAIEADLQAGRDVVINGSREYVPQLLKSFPQARVVWIDADEEQIRERLHARGREAGPALFKRLDRASRFTPLDLPAVIRLTNNGSLDVAGRQMLQILQEP